MRREKRLYCANIQMPAAIQLTPTARLSGAQRAFGAALRATYVLRRPWACGSVVPKKRPLYVGSTPLRAHGAGKCIRWCESRVGAFARLPRPVSISLERALDGSIGPYSR
jgi:hypothetical protein